MTFLKPEVVDALEISDFDSDVWYGYDELWNKASL